MTTPVSPLLRRLLASLVVVLCLGVGSVLRADEPAKSFDIPAGDAAAALKKFSEQSGNQVIFPEDAVAGAVTSELKGDYAPAEAMTHLLAGSGLKSHRDAKSGSFAVTRQANLQPDLDPNVSRAIAQDSVRPAKNPMTEENANGEKVIKLDTLLLLRRHRSLTILPLDPRSCFQPSLHTRSPQAQRSIRPACDIVLLIGLHSAQAMGRGSCRRV